MTISSSIRHRSGSLSRIEDLTRREFLSSALAAALLIACSDDDEDAPAPEATTRTIDDYFGPVTVPATPQRVVAADSVSLLSMLALGIKPVAAAVNANSLPHHLSDQMTGVDNVSGDDGIDLEKALIHNPDLIFMSAGISGGTVNEERYRRYQAVVPTFAYTHHYSYIEQVVANLNQVARVLDREQEAQKRVQEYEDRVAALKARIEKADLTDRPVSARDDLEEPGLAGPRTGQERPRARGQFRYLEQHRYRRADVRPRRHRAHVRPAGRAGLAGAVASRRTRP